MLNATNVLDAVVHSKLNQSVRLGRSLNASKALALEDSETAASVSQRPRGHVQDDSIQIMEWT